MLNHSTLLPDNIHEDYVHPAVYIGAAIALALIGFFGFTMNLMVVVVIVKDAQNLWTPVNVILVNLVVGDFLVAALGIPVAMVSAITGGWYWGYKMCLWYAWFMSTLGFASIGNLTVMAVERWLLVARPMRALSIRCTRKTGSEDHEDGRVDDHGLPARLVALRGVGSRRSVFRREAVSVGSRAASSASEVLYLLQPDHLRGPKQPIPTVSEEDIRRTEHEDHDAGQPKHGVDRPEQTGSAKLRTLGAVPARNSNRPAILRVLA
ncbi:uncharacterized protein LOC143360927 isoform X2 [Halictus rubicundus]|uniref:uncharacterized protein LOC143360927 isoform X2 n=1 Tax=Halictus rubicundus TaxID=77578 RepID=UPI004035F1FD